MMSVEKSRFPSHLVGNGSTGRSRSHSAVVVVVVSAVVVVAVVHLAGDEFGRRESLRSEVALLQLKDAVTTGRMTVAWMELPFLKSVSKLI